MTKRKIIRNIYNIIYILKIKWLVQIIILKMIKKDLKK